MAAEFGALCVEITIAISHDMTITGVANCSRKRLYITIMTAYITVKKLIFFLNTSNHLKRPTIQTATAMN